MIKTDLKAFITAFTANYRRQSEGRRKDLVRHAGVLHLDMQRYWTAQQAALLAGKDEEFTALVFANVSMLDTTRLSPGTM